MRRLVDGFGWRRGARGLLVAVMCGGCTAGDPSASDMATNDDSLSHGARCHPAVSFAEDVSGCTRPASDYTPRVANSASDAWPACISDDNSYHALQSSVSTIARVSAFEVMAALLWDNTVAPSAQDFIDARLAYEEEQGLSSRLARRYDIHYAKPTSGGCEDAAVAAAHPDYCVGPATLQPLVVAALAAGAQGRSAVVNAARIEAALQWFLYLSVLKEAATCATAPQDCDSSWAYYSGGAGRDAPVGLARLVARLAPETHQYVWDGLLALRCWKNLDNESGTSTNMTLRNQAMEQIDRALLRGLAMVAKERFLQLECASLDYQQAALAALQVLVPRLDRATRARDSAAADALLAEIAKSADAVDVTGAVALLDTLYACP